ncbi:MAG: 50S ribosomal protein L3, partial [Fervidicoccaceae archaeon]
MGHRKKHAPRRGSLGVRPRKRASSIIPRIRSWPRVEEGPVKPLGFLGYKVGMTHAIIIDDRPGSPTYGREIFAPLTVVETPPMIVAGVRLYESGSSGGKSLRALTEVWASLDILERAHVRRLIKNFHGTSEEIKSKVEGLIDRISDVRLLMLSQPSLITGVPKKKPDLVEVALAGIDVSEKLNYALSKIGSAVRVSEIFRAGQFVDVLGVTKGKGFQGVIK